MFLLIDYILTKTMKCVLTLPLLVRIKAKSFPAAIDTASSSKPVPTTENKFQHLVPRIQLLLYKIPKRRRQNSLDATL